MQPASPLDENPLNAHLKAKLVNEKSGSFLCSLTSACSSNVTRAEAERESELKEVCFHHYGA